MTEYKIRRLLLSNDESDTGIEDDMYHIVAEYYDSTEYDDTEECLEYDILVSDIATTYYPPDREIDDMLKNIDDYCKDLNIIMPEFMEIEDT